jgi:hypothetical protein
MAEGRKRCRNYKGMLNINYNRTFLLIKFIVSKYVKCYQLYKY